MFIKTDVRLFLSIWIHKRYLASLLSLLLVKFLYVPFLNFFLLNLFYYSLTNSILNIKRERFKWKHIGAILCSNSMSFAQFNLLYNSLVNSLNECRAKLLVLDRELSKLSILGIILLLGKIQMIFFSLLERFHLILVEHSDLARLWGLDFRIMESLFFNLFIMHIVNFSSSDIECFEDNIVLLFRTCIFIILVRFLSRIWSCWSLRIIFKLLSFFPRDLTLIRWWIVVNLGLLHCFLPIF